MAASLAMVSVGRAETFVPQDWAFRWRISASVLLALGLGTLVAGVGLVKKRRWALVLGEPSDRGPVCTGGDEVAGFLKVRFRGDMMD